MAVSLDKERGVGVITMDRPPANSYDIAFARELGAAIDDARIDEEIGAVVLRSASEKFFSAGADVGAFQKGSPRQRWMTVLLMHEVLRKMETTPLIFIAEIAGPRPRAAASRSRSPATSASPPTATTSSACRR